MDTRNAINNIVRLASKEWMDNNCAADRQLYALGIALADMKKIVNKILRFNYTPSVSDDKTEWIMKGVFDYECQEPEGNGGLFIVEVLGVVVQVWPSEPIDYPATDLFLDISWRPPSANEHCIVDGKIVDQFVDAIGIHNCKTIAFCTGAIYLSDPEESIFCEPYVVLHKR